MMRSTVPFRLKFLSILSLVLAATLGLAGSATAEERRSFDARVVADETIVVAPSAVQHAAIADWSARIPSLTVRFDASLGVTRSIGNRVGYLSEPSAGDPVSIALDFVSSNVDLLGLTRADLDGFEITDIVPSRNNGSTHIYLRQRSGGLPVYNGQLQINVNRDGRILSVNNAFVHDLASATNRRQPGLGAADALGRAALHLGVNLSTVPQVVATDDARTGRYTLRAPQLTDTDIDTRLFWLPIRRGEARLVWNFQVPRPNGVHHFDMTVDAVDGRIWTRFDWVDAGSYRVFGSPIESPQHSATPPPADGRTLIVDPEDATASPLGWHDDGTTARTIMRGNNVHSFEDSNGNGSPPAVEPDCGVSLVCDFDFPIDFGIDDPTTYTSASVAELFYWNNIVHDVQYFYGFDEASGNFQEDNFGNGGVGSDSVFANAQDGGFLCPNNAFFGTGPDGNNGSMTMCLFTSSTPDRDFVFDHGVLVHEFGHGISNRLVGGPSNTSCLDNTQQGGEGYSDWWSLVHTARVGDAGTDVRGSGTYILGQPVGGSGVRPQPYSTDPAVNTYTFESISGLSIPHGLGSVWAQAAWEVYWALVDEHGFSPDFYDAMGGFGNQRAMLYTIEGMKNAPCSPSFLDMRDGFIQAAVDNFGGVDVCRMWQAFADFGLGADASTPSPNASSATNGFAVPAECDGSNEIFADGFESGTTAAWSSAIP